MMAAARKLRSILCGCGARCVKNDGSNKISHATSARVPVTRATHTKDLARTAFGSALLVIENGIANDQVLRPSTKTGNKKEFGAHEIACKIYCGLAKTDRQPTLLEFKRAVTTRWLDDEWPGADAN
jgi:hypothetical protein